MTDFLKACTSLHDRQRLYYNGSHCPYCGNQTDITDSIEVYQESHGLIYICRPCKAWVGMHSSATDQSYGFVAKKDLRDLRKEARQMFDYLWIRKTHYGVSRKTAQIKARAWLADELKINVVECHFGMFDVERCKAAMEILKAYIPTPEQVAEIKKGIEVKKQMIEFLCDSMNIEFKRFDLMTGTEYTFAKGEKKYFYRLKDNAGYWDGKKMKFIPMEIPIDEFLENNF